MDAINLKENQSTQKSNSNLTTLTLCKKLENINFFAIPMQSANTKWDPSLYVSIEKGLTNLIALIPSLKKSIVWLDFEGITIDVLLTKDSDLKDILNRTKECFGPFTFNYKETFFKDGTCYLRMSLMVQTITV